MIYPKHPQSWPDAPEVARAVEVERARGSTAANAAMVSRIAERLHASLGAPPSGGDLSPWRKQTWMDQGSEAVESLANRMSGDRMSGVRVAVPPGHRRAWVRWLAAFAVSGLSLAVLMGHFLSIPLKAAPAGRGQGARASVVSQAAKELPSATVPAVADARGLLGTIDLGTVGVNTLADAPPAARSPSVGRGASAVQSAPEGSSQPTVVRERILISEARAALARGDTMRADSLLRDHALAFPQGELAQEREALRVRLLEARGFHEAARYQAEQMRRAFPNGPSLGVYVGGSP